MLIADAAVVVPCSITADKNENKAISTGSKWPNQAIRTPVKPLPPTIEALNVWLMPQTIKKPIKPIMEPVNIIVLIMTLLTFIPTYLAVLRLSPTTDIS